jgi:hypothetical protein
MNKLQITYSLAVIVGLFAATLVHFNNYVFPYTTDSASYIEQARSLLTRGVFEEMPDTIEDSSSGGPSTLFPPGYPVLIAVFSKVLQIQPEFTGVLLSKLAVALLPICIVFSIQKILGIEYAFIISLLVVFAPAVIHWGGVASSDIISMLLAIFCIGLTIKAADNLLLWFIVGLLAGFSYLIRNANLALVLSICGFLAWSIALDSEQRRKRIYSAGIWLLGCAIPVVPWMIRNLIVFGKIQPYSMDASTIGLTENISTFVEAQLNVLLSWGVANRLIGLGILGIILLAIVLGLLARQVWVTWKQWKKIEQQTFFIATLYFILGSAVVVIARTKYQWGEIINERHTIAYLFCLLVILALILKNIAVTNPQWLVVIRSKLPMKVQIDSVIQWCGLVVALVFLSIRLQYISASYQHNQPDHQYDHLMAAMEQAKKDPICTQLDGRFAVSNYHFIYQIVCAAPVRYIPTNIVQNGMLESLLKLPVTKGVLVSIFPDHKIDEKNFPLKQAILTQLSATGWFIEKNEKTGIILTR